MIDSEGFTECRRRRRNTNSLVGRNFEVSRPNESKQYFEDDEFSDDMDNDDESIENKIIECPLIWHQFALVGDIKTSLDNILDKFKINLFMDCRPLSLLGPTIVDGNWQWEDPSDCENDLLKYARQCGKQFKFVSIIPNFTPREYGKGRKIYFIHIRFDSYYLAEATPSENTFEYVQPYYGFLGEKLTHVPISLDCDDVEDNRTNFIQIMKIVEGKMKHDKFQEPNEEEQRNSDKRLYYDPLTKKDLSLCRNSIYKCKLYLEDCHSGYGQIMDQTNLERKIYLHNRRNCFQAFNQDIVNIMVFQKSTEKIKIKNNVRKAGQLKETTQSAVSQIWTGRVISVEHSEIRPINKIFLCKLVFGQANYMIPICKTFPTIEVDNTAAKDRVKNNFNNLIDGLSDVRGIENLMMRSVKLENCKSFADKSFVTLKRLNTDLETTLKRIQFVDCYRCDFIFLVIYRKWNGTNRFPFGEVVGLYTPDASFAKTMPLIIVSCNLSIVDVDNDPDVKLEVEKIKKETRNNRHSAMNNHSSAVDRKIFSFSYKNRPFNEVAYSYESLDDTQFKLGLHVINVEKYIKAGKTLDRYAKKQFFTYLLPVYQRTDETIKPLYILSEEITKNLLSITKERKVDVLSFYFNVDIATLTVENNGSMDFEQIALTDVIDVDEKENIVKVESTLSTILVQMHRTCYNNMIKRNKSHCITSDWFYPDYTLKWNMLALIISNEMASLTNGFVANLLSRRPETSFPVNIDETVLHGTNLRSWMDDVRQKCPIRYFPTLHKWFKFNAPVTPIKTITFSRQVLEKARANRNTDLIKCDMLFPDVSYYKYKLDNIISRDIIRPHSEAGESSFTVSITKPLSCFGDLLLQRLVTCCKLDKASGYDANTITEICTLYNDCKINLDKYRSICRAYDIKEKFENVSFILDCVYEDVTDDSIIFHHPFLRHVHHNSFIYFEHLGLNDVKFLSPTIDGTKNVELDWVTRIFIAGDGSHDNTLELKYKLKDIYSHETEIWRKNLIFTDFIANDEEKISIILSENKYPKPLISETVRYMDPKITFSFKLERKQILRIQLNYDYSSGIMKISPELLIVNPHLRLCLCHRNDPFKYFIHPNELSKINYKRFLNLDQYKEQFRVLNRIEGIDQTISERASYFIHDVDICWIGTNCDESSDDIHGVVILDHSWCTERFIKLGHKNLRIQDPVNTLKKAVEYCKMEFLACIQSFIETKQVYWLGHAQISDVAYIGDAKNMKVHLTLRLIHSNFPIKPKLGQLYSLEIMETPITARILDRSLRKLKANSLGDRIVMKRISNKENKDHVSIDYDKDIQSSMKRPYALNEAQNKALQLAINREFSLIWGPPGTGKTMVGCIIAFAFTQINKRPPSDNSIFTVLYCGPSNQSVDVVAEKLMNTFGDKCPKLLRIFSSDVMNVDFPYPGGFVNRDISGTPDSLKHIALHHIVRLPGKPYADTFEKYAKYFKDNIVRDKVSRKEYSVRVLKYQSILKLAFNQEVLEGNYEIVLSTTVGSCKKLLDNCKIAQVIIDECGMCSEPEAIGPILERKYLKNTVFIGDHKQLRPIITCEAAKGKMLNRSLFERIYDSNITFCTMLDTQYRMHPSICEFPSKYFYKEDNARLITALSENWSGIPDFLITNISEFNGLQNFDVNLKKNYPRLLDKNNVNIADKLWTGRRCTNFSCYPRSLDFTKPVMEKILFIKVEGHEKNQPVSGKMGHVKSKGNEEEVIAVKRLYKKLIANNKKESGSQSILVITQYQLQENLLRAACKEALTELKKPGDPRVSTVVKSQGSECDYVIFSTVRSLPNSKDIDLKPSPGWIKKYLGFITDMNQFNVAITRAKKGLFIIGNSNLLSVNQNWMSLITDLKNRGCMANSIFDLTL